jgi:ribosomal protein L37E
MVQFINATQARGEIERILSKAKYDMVMISPYIKINDDFISRLSDAGQRKVKILMVCRNEDLKPGEREKLELIPNLEIRFNERVHAKCFYNEDTMVISSLNLYDSSLGDNREMGVLLRNTDSDKEAFTDAKAEAQFIIRECQSGTSRFKPVPSGRDQIAKKTVEYKPKVQTQVVNEPNVENTIVKNLSNFFSVSKNEDEQGNCIRCGEIISFNLEAPYCPECYRTWEKYKDQDYKEKYCLKCGRPDETSMKRPL